MAQPPILLESASAIDSQTTANEQRRQRVLAARQKRRTRVATVLVSLLCVGGVIAALVGHFGRIDILPLSPPPSAGVASDGSPIPVPEWVTQAYLDIDGEARSGRKLEAVRGLAIHYVGNPNTTAMNNRNYFNQPGVDVSSHFIVGLEGEVVQCLPLDERSVATNQRNGDTISIETCHPDESGKFSDVTYDSLIRLIVWLCRQYGLTADDLLRHYDVSGKLCPLYYVENEDAWLQLKADVTEALAQPST